MTTLCQIDWVESRDERAIRLAATGLPAVPVRAPAFRYVPSAVYPRQPIPFRGSSPTPIQEPSP